MMARPVAQYLMHFDRGSDAPPVSDRLVEFAPIEAWSSEPAPLVVEDHSFEIEAAREAGKAEGYEAAAAEFAEQLESERQSHQEQLGAARAAWLEGEGERLHAQLDAGLAEIEARLAEGLANVLQPFITDVLRKQMIAELTENVLTLIASSEAISITVSGAGDLVETLRARLAQTRSNVAYEITDSVDVIVRADQTVIETQLSTWTARIAGEME